MKKSSVDPVENAYNLTSMRRNLPIILLGIALVALVGVSSYTDSQGHDRQNHAENSAHDGVAQDNLSRSTQEAPTSTQVPIWRVLLAWPEGVTTLAVLLTLFFIAWQAILMRQSVSGSEEASRRELRAYLTVVIGAALFQERRDEEKGGDLKFECRPLLVNTGRTPARKVIFKARAAVMPIPLPKGINLPDAPDEDMGGNILGSQQNANMSAVVDGFCADKDVENIKHGIGDKALYVWGRVTYEDVFGEDHFTRFCHHVYWDLNGDVRGHYIPGRNDAD